jgi:hypothetical protein
MKRTLALLAAVTLPLIVARDAAAGAPGYWPWFSGSVYTSHVRGLPPYFSLYPPVYYSYPVPRTYGYSPFAYPLGTPTPEVTITDAPSKIMINPYVPRSQTTSQADKSTDNSRMILNPYVEQRVELARDGE